MNTNLIPTKAHGYIDYATAASLMTLPLIFSGKKKGVETWLPVVMGAGVVVQSLLTAYEMGAKDSLKMKNHLRLDYLQGALLAASPFLFGFRKRSWVHHLAVGLSELAVAFLTTPKPKKKRKLFGIFSR